MIIKIITLILAIFLINYVRMVMERKKVIAKMYEELNQISDSLFYCDSFQRLIVPLVRGLISDNQTDLFNAVYKDYLDTNSVSKNVSHLCANAISQMLITSQTDKEHEELTAAFEKIKKGIDSAVKQA